MRLTHVVAACSPANRCPSSLPPSHVPLRRQAADPAAGFRAGIRCSRPSATFDEGDYDFVREVGEVVVKPTRGNRAKHHRRHSR